MMLPISASHAWGLVLALVVGLGFGFVLERVGFGRSLKLTGQFYLKDMTVFKVMFTAVVTAAIGLVVLDGVGVLSLRALTEMAASETFIWPMLIGGFVLGVGFVISGYCPGTSIVAWASGHLDGMMTVVGVYLGSWLFAETFPLVKGFHTSGARGLWRLYDALGVPPAVLVAIVALVAIGLFVGAELVERRMARDPVADEQKEPRYRARRRVAFSVLAGSAVLGVATLLLPQPAASTGRRFAEPISAESLARRLIESPWALRVLDVRAQAACAEARVPGAECVPQDKLEDLGLAYASGDRLLVLVGDEAVGELPRGVAPYKGRVLTLEGGFAAWHDFALASPTSAPGLASDAAERARYELRGALQRVLTGAPQAPPPPPAAAPSFVAPKKKKGGGCG